LLLLVSAAVQWTFCHHLLLIYLLTYLIWMDKKEKIKMCTS